MSAATISSELFHGASACVAATAWDIYQRPTLNPAGARPLGRFSVRTFPLPRCSSGTQGVPRGSGVNAAVLSLAQPQP